MKARLQTNTIKMCYKKHFIYFALLNKHWMDFVSFIKFIKKTNPSNNKTSLSGRGHFCNHTYGSWVILNSISLNSDQFGL